MECSQILCQYEIMKSHFMHKVWNNSNPKKLGKKHICVSKLWENLYWIMWVLDYARSSQMYPHIKCDCTAHIF
jgi:hypothetical protein